MSPRPAAPKTDEVEDTVAADTEPQTDLGPVLAGISQLTDTLKGINESVQTLAKRVDRIENPHLPPPPEDLLPEPLPEGIVRFWSKASDYQIFVEDEVTTEVDGELVIRKTRPRKATRSGRARAIQFQHHIRDIDLSEEGAEALVKYLEGHPDYGVDFVIDPTARAKVTDLEVKAGIRGAAEQAAEKPPLSATF